MKFNKVYFIKLGVNFYTFAIAIDCIIFLMFSVPFNECIQFLLTGIELVCLLKEKCENASIKIFNWAKELFKQFWKLFPISLWLRFGFCKTCHYVNHDMVSYSEGICWSSCFQLSLPLLWSWRSTGVCISGISRLSTNSKFFPMLSVSGRN